MPCVVRCVLLSLLNHPGAIPIGVFYNLLKRYEIYGCSLLYLDNFDTFPPVWLFFFVFAIEVECFK